MSKKSIKLAAWLLASGCAFLQPLTGHAQKSTHLPAAKSLKEFYENGSSYFPFGTFKKPDGSPDDHHGDVMAWYLRRIQRERTAHCAGCRTRPGDSCLALRPATGSAEKRGLVLWHARGSLYHTNGVLVGWTLVRVLSHQQPDKPPSRTS